MHNESERKSTSVLFLRHGQTNYPKNRYYDDAIEDPHLNQIGLKQAEAWPVYFNRNPKSIAAVYVSPSQRTQETAKIATEGLDLSFQTLDDLGEWRFGAWGGLTVADIKTKYPKEWKAWRANVVDFNPPEGESLRQFSERVNGAVSSLVARHPEQYFLVVTHAGAIRMIVSAALEMPLTNFKRLVIGHGSLTEIEYTDRWPNLHSFSFFPEII